MAVAAAPTSRSRSRNVARQPGAAEIPPAGCDALLANHFLLRHLPAEQLARLAATATVVHHAPGRTIFQRGDPGESLMIVVTGQVKICNYSLDGKEMILGIIGRGGLFGEIAVLDGQPRSADAVAIGKTDLLVLRRQQLMPFLTNDPEIAARLIGVLCQRLRQSSEQLEDALLRDAPGRLARCLLRLGNTHGVAVGAGVRLTIKLSQQQLGNLTGISRESINKYLSEWCRAGYLTMEGGLIRVENRAFMQDISETRL